MAFQLQQRMASRQARLVRRVGPERLAFVERPPVRTLVLAALPPALRLLFDPRTNWSVARIMYLDRRRATGAILPFQHIGDHTVLLVLIEG